MVTLQAEERLLMVEEQRKLAEERARIEQEHKRLIKEEQQKILNKGKGRPKLSFSLKPSWHSVICGAY